MGLLSLKLPHAPAANAGRSMATGLDPGTDPATTIIGWPKQHAKFIGVTKIAMKVFDHRRVG